MESKKILFNNIEIEAYVNDGLYVMESHHTHCYNFANLNKILLSGNEKALQIYLPGIAPHNFRKGGWSPNLSTLIGLEAHYKVCALEAVFAEGTEAVFDELSLNPFGDDDEVPEPSIYLKSNFYICDLHRILTFIEDFLEGSYLNQNEMLKIYKLVANLQRPESPARPAREQLYVPLYAPKVQEGTLVPASQASAVPKAKRSTEAKPSAKAKPKAPKGSLVPKAKRSAKAKPKTPKGSLVPKGTSKEKDLIAIAKRVGVGIDLPVEGVDIDFPQAEGTSKPVEKQPEPKETLFALDEDMTVDDFLQLARQTPLDDEDYPFF